MKPYLSQSFDPGDRVTFFDELPLWSAPFGWKLLDHVRYRPDITALDIGFGTGFPLIELAMRLGHTSTVYGIDPWKEAITRAKQKITYYSLENVQIIEGVAEAIPLEDNTIDLIVSNNGLNNVSDPEQVLSECARVARPGAQLVMTVNLDESFIEFYNVLAQILSELKLLAEIERMSQHIYHKRKPLEETHALLERHGFEIREQLPDQFEYKFTDGSAMLNHGFVRLALIPAWKSFLPEDRLEEIFNDVESRLNAEARSAGGIQLTVPFVVLNASKR